MTKKRRTRWTLLTHNNWLAEKRLSGFHHTAAPQKAALSQTGSHLHCTIGASLCRTPGASQHSPAARCSAPPPHSLQAWDRSPMNSGLCSVDIRRALFGLASSPCVCVARIASLTPPLARPRHSPQCSGCSSGASPRRCCRHRRGGLHSFERFAQPGPVWLRLGLP